MFGFMYIFGLLCIFVWGVVGVWIVWGVWEDSGGWRVLRDFGWRRDRGIGIDSVGDCVNTLSLLDVSHWVNTQIYRIAVNRTSFKIIKPCKNAVLLMSA